MQEGFRVAYFRLSADIPKKYGKSTDIQLIFPSFHLAL